MPNRAQVTRFAPTPSGYLHLGHAFSALIAYESRGPNGRFLLRIEDIDAARCRDEFVRAIYDDLRWLGIGWETPVRRQSAHMHDYQTARAALAEFTYPCFCSRAEIKTELARIARAPHAEDPPAVGYPGTCRHLSMRERKRRINAGEPYAERLDLAAALAEVGELTWHEVGRGEVPAQPQSFGDVVLARKDTPTSYHLSVTVDDHLQGVTLVTRGEDLAPSTHLHRLLQALLGYATPAYQHHPLRADSNGIRLSKRHRSLTLRELRARGVSPKMVRKMALESAPIC